jgi:hypothetical protein
MAKAPKSTDAERTPAETERIREATLKRILSTPPKRHADMIKERKAARRKTGKAGK